MKRTIASRQRQVNAEPFSSLDVHLPSPYYQRTVPVYWPAGVRSIIIFLFTMRLFVKGLTAGAVKG
jgi:hypothetical protein